MSASERSTAPRDELVDGARFAKAHLGLLRVDVDVDQPRIEVQPQRIGGLAILMQHVAIGLAQRVREHAVADEAAVDERIPSARRCRVRRPHREARQRQRAGAGIDDGGALDEGVAQQRLDAGAPPCGSSRWTTRPLCCSVKPTSGCARAMRLNASSQ
ncbi:MAG: hypothetical protein IPN24_16080 [Betaproteobacteria bacterium]|nr:hypothetical protein [Betaproteobacteria bacterium]